MFSHFNSLQFDLPRRFLFVTIVAAFLFSSFQLPQSLYAQTVSNLPQPGAMIVRSHAFTPLLIEGMTVHPENPLLFDFIVDAGDSGMEGESLKAESSKLIKYFMASLAVPEEELWVNLSPYEKDRIISPAFGITDMGRDLLAQDYVLKQLTASLIYPENELGKKFWGRVKQKALEKYGTTEIPINTFNKVWIIPQKAVVYEHGNSAYVVDSYLKVMLEQDYLSMQKHENVVVGHARPFQTNDVSALGSQVVREIIVPEIEKEVNEGKNFAGLRQVYNSLILAVWYKKNLKESLLSQLYVGKDKVQGIDIQDKAAKDKIYKLYLEAFKKGVYNYIKEDYDPLSQQVVARKYFSGGFAVQGIDNLEQEFTDGDLLRLPAQKAMITAKLGVASQARFDVKISLLADNPFKVQGSKEKAITASSVSNAMLSFRPDPIQGDIREAYGDILSPEALDVLGAVAPLTDEGKALMLKRNERFMDRQNHRKKIDFLDVKNADGTDAVIPGTNITVKDARAGKFRGAPIPKDLQRQWIQLTGPAAKSPQDKAIDKITPKNKKEWLKEDLRNVAHALLSKADGMMFDGEDALGQSETMSLDNIRSLTTAYRKDPLFMEVVKEIAQEYVNAGKRPDSWQNEAVKLIEENFTTRIYRVRGLHLDDRHIRYQAADGTQKAVSGTIADMVLYVVNNYKTLQAQGSSIALYLPKLQTAEEAAYMAKILDAIEQKLNLKQGTIKTFVLIEQLEESFQLMEIRAALGKHFVGFNTGRWDYIADVVKQNMWDENWMPPNFKEMTMTYPFMANYEARVKAAVNTPDEDGNRTLWIGGMEPQIPVIKGQMEDADKFRAKANAFAIARKSKQREFEAGASGSWCAHPGMVEELRKVWQEGYAGKTNADGSPMTNSMGRDQLKPLTYDVTAQASLTELMPGKRTVAEARFLISVALQYVNAYLTGRAAAALKGADFFGDPSVLFIMEDMATGEGRTKLARKWWKHNGEITEDDNSLGIKKGDKFTEELMRKIVEEEYKKLLVANNVYVYDTTKTKELPIARMIIDKFLFSDVDLPWLVDLANAGLDVSNLGEATSRVEAYITEYKESKGLKRITDFPPSTNFAMLSFRPDSTVGNVENAYQDILTPKAKEVLIALAPLAKDCGRLRDERNVRQKQHKKINFLPVQNADGSPALIPGTNITVEDARNGNFEGSEIPHDLQRQYMQSTWPAALSPEEKPGNKPNTKEWADADLENVARALLNGYDGMMFEGEDMLGQLGTMSLDNIRALTLAFNKDERFMKAAKKVAKEYIREGKQKPEWDWQSLINKNFTTRIFRPRGLHLDDRHIRILEAADGKAKALPATIVDIALYVVNNYKALRKQNSSIVLYLPKLQTAEEAAYMARVMETIEDQLGLERGTIKAFVLVEQEEAAFQLMEIRAALGKHFVGFNTGRWDYIADVLQQNTWDPHWVPPNFSTMNMSYPFMQEYLKRVRNACFTPDKNGKKALWISGMQGELPVLRAHVPKGEAYRITNAAIQKAIAGKTEEFKMGASGSMAGHPVMMRRLRDIWVKGFRKRSGLHGSEITNWLGIKIGEPLTYETTDQEALTQLADPVGPRTIEETKSLINLSLQYLNSYLSGRAAIALKDSDAFSNLSVLYSREEMSNVEGRLKLIRLWLKHRAPITDITLADNAIYRPTFSAFTPGLMKRIIDLEVEKLLAIQSSAAERKHLLTAKMVIEKFLFTEQDLPWVIDLANAALNEDRLIDAEEHVNHFITYFTMTDGGRLTTKGDDAQSIADPAQNVGGINLNPKLFDLETRRDKNGLILPAFRQSIQALKNFKGFLLVILNIQRMTGAIIK